jgi:acetyl esterase/lipase
VHWTPAGVAVTATRYNGMIHDFGLLNPLAHISGAHSAMLQVGAGLRKHRQ